MQERKATAANDLGASLTREIDQVAASRARKLIAASKFPFGEHIFLSPSVIRYDPLYQRPVSIQRVNEIVKEFDPELFGALHLGYRGGVHYVIDGQHRLGAALNLNLAEIPCIRYYTKNAQEEARIFVALQEKRRRLLPTHRFLAKLAYGDQTALDIAALLRKYRFSIEEYPLFEQVSKRNTLRAIGLLERIYRRGGKRRLNDVLFVARRAWEGEPEALRETPLGGLARYMERTAYDLDRVASKLSKQDPFTLTQRAIRVGHNNGISRQEAFADVLESFLSK